MTRLRDSITLALLLGACAALAGCAKEDAIVTYRLEKPGPSAPAPDAAPDTMPAGMPAAMPGAPASPSAPATAGAPGELSWKLPKGWKEKPLTDMRVGSFSAPGKDGQAADISVVVLGGEAGGALANVNRWRDQLELAPIGEAELPRYERKIAPGGRAMRLVELVSKGPFIEGKHKKRLVAVSYARGGRTWFFKMTGEDALVRRLEPSLLRFLESLRFAGKEGA